MSAAKLSAALGGAPIKIKGLAAADAARLAEMVDDAKVRQQQALDDAIDGGLGHIPRLLRGPVRKVLF